MHQIKCQVCGESFYIEEKRCPYCFSAIGAKKFKVEDEDRKKLEDYIFSTMGTLIGWVSTSEIKEKVIYDISSADLTSYLEELVSKGLIWRKEIDGETLYTGDPVLYDFENFEEDLA